MSESKAASRMDAMVTPAGVFEERLSEGESQECLILAGHRLVRDIEEADRIGDIVAQVAERVAEANLAAGRHELFEG